jgi:hypothetical protein
MVASQRDFLDRWCFMLQDLDANKDSLRLLCFFCDAESAIPEEDESHAIETCYIDISYIIYHICDDVILQKSVNIIYNDTPPYQALPYTC